MLAFIGAAVVVLAVHSRFPWWRPWCRSLHLPALFWETLQDRDVLRAIWVEHLHLRGLASVIAIIFGTPFCLSCWPGRNFPAKRLAESVVDLPIMIPHPVVGIALLSIAGRNHPFGELLLSLGCVHHGVCHGHCGRAGLCGHAFLCGHGKSRYRKRAAPAGKGFQISGRRTGCYFFPDYAAAFLALPAGGYDSVHGQGHQRIRGLRHRGLPSDGRTGADVPSVSPPTA